MFFSNVVQFSRSYPLPLSSTASSLYHPLPLLSTPFLYLFSLPVPTPVCLVNFFQLIVENLQVSSAVCHSFSSLWHIAFFRIKSGHFAQRCVCVFVENGGFAVVWRWFGGKCLQKYEFRLCCLRSGKSYAITGRRYNPAVTQVPFRW